MILMEVGTPVLVVYRDDDMFSGSFPATILKRGKFNTYSVVWSEGEHKGTVTHNVHINNIECRKISSKRPIDLTMEVSTPPPKRLKSKDVLQDYDVFSSDSDDDASVLSDASLKTFSVNSTSSTSTSSRSESTESNETPIADTSCEQKPTTMSTDWNGHDLMEIIASDTLHLDMLKEDHDRLKKQFLEYTNQMEIFRKTLIDSIRELKNNI